MAEPRRPRAKPHAAKALDELRPLLVGPEQRRIQRLEDRMDHQLGEMVACVLPEAVTTSRKRGDALAWAVEPLVESSVRATVRRDPRAFAEAIAPAMGSAIRAAVAERLRVLIQRVNEALNRSLSVQSMRWRVEALRTGRPFAEVVLVRTLVYRVEEVLLIHRGTGLVLGHARGEEVTSRDPDQVSAMLSAIETFAHEAFQEEARLERFRVGETVGWIEHGPAALLVAIVRGTAPESYEAVLREALDRMELEHAKALDAFRGDVAPFASTEEVLSGCLRESRALPRRRWITPTAAVAILLTVLAATIFFAARASRRAEALFAAYTGALQAEPGLVVISGERRPGRYLFAGLRDPLASDPATVLARRGLDPAAASLRFDPFYSLDLRLVGRRAAKVLRPPDGVSLALRGHTLEARGVAAERWIDRARSLAIALPGVEAFDDAHLYKAESVAAERAAADAIEHAELIFPPGSARLPPEQRARLDGIAAEARRMLALLPAVGMTARIDVIGYSDPIGSAAYIQALSAARARYVVAELERRGVAGDKLDARGGGVRPGEGHERARSVTFHVDQRAAEND